MAGPIKKKQAREEKNTEEASFLSVSNSEYNVCTPMLNAAFIRMTHPHTKKDMHFSTNSPEFFATFKEFCDKGVADKLFRELTYFGAHIDTRWFDVLHDARTYCDSQAGQ